MKIRFSSILIILSVLFFSCRGLSQEDTGEVSVDVGKAARHVIHYTSNSSSNDLNDMEGFEQYFGIIEYVLKISVSTSGTYSTSTEAVYSVTASDIMNAGSEEALEEYYEQAFTTPITIDSIPVDSRIKVKATISMGVTIDKAALRRLLLEQGVPPEYIDEVMNELMAEFDEFGGEEDVAEGVSDEITVKSGTNNVKIQIQNFLLDDDDDDDGNNGGTGSGSGGTGSGGSSEEGSGNGGGNGNGGQEQNNPPVDYESGLDFVLYNANNSGTRYYLTEKTGFQIVDTSDPDYESSSTKNSFCFDSEGGFYALGKDGQGQNVIISDNYPDKTITDISNTLSGITIDRETDVLYAWYGMQETYEIYIFPDFVSSGSVDHTDIGTLPANSVTFDSQFGSYPYHDNDILVVNDGVIYGYGCGGGQTELMYNKFYKIDLSETPLAAEKITIGYSSFGITDDSVVTDLIYQEGDLYILVKDISSNIFPEYSPSFGSGFPIRSRGALIKYSFSEQVANCLGWTSYTLSTTGKYVYGYADYQRTQKLMTEPDTAGSNSEKRYKESISLIESIFPTLTVPSNDYVGFYGPRKFVAIKPRRLYIADDGIAFYADDYDAFCSSNVNRIVVVNLDNFEILNSMDTIVTFNGEETGSYIGGSGFEFYKTNYNNNEPSIYIEDESDMYWDDQDNDRVYFTFPLTADRNQSFPEILLCF